VQHSSFKSQDYTEEGICLLRTRNFASTGYVVKDEIIYLPLDFYKKFKTYQLRKFDILLVMVGASVGSLGLITSNVLPALQNQNMWNFRAKGKNHQLFLKHLINKIAEEKIGTASGSARDFFRKDYFKKIDFIEPSNEIMCRFNNLVTPIYELINKNIHEIETLSQTRDSLLPKLMSGKIRIPVEAR
jgi:type I restriction enzyme S subunit